MLAIPSADNKDTRDILRICNETTCKLKVLPGVYQLINDEVSVSKLREVVALSEASSADRLLHIIRECLLFLIYMKIMHMIYSKN